VHNEYLYPGGPKIRVAAYDDQGAQARQTTLTLGPEGELISQSGSAESVGYTYDAAYRLKTISDGKNQTTSYTYDEVGNLATVELVNGDTVQYPEHDPLGNVLKRIDPNDVTTTYKYDDPQSLLTDIEYPDTPSLDVHYNYDSAYGRVTSVEDGTGTISFDYDDLDLVTSAVTTYTYLPARTVEYSYYSNGSLDTLTTPVGDFEFTYDSAGRPTGLTNPFSESFSWTYYNNNWLDTQTSPVSVSDFARAAFWKRKLPDLQFKPLAENLTKIEADGLEQVFIESYGGTSGYSNGGSLINRINNISPNNDYYGIATGIANGLILK
jgi:YD repeat-containing protein